MVARCERHAKESARTSFRHIVGYDQVKKKIHPRVFVNVQVGGHLEIQDGRQSTHLQKREGGFSFSLGRNLLYAERTYEHSLSHAVRT